jgi:hypothetical protein
MAKKAKDSSSSKKGKHSSSKRGHSSRSISHKSPHVTRDSKTGRFATKKDKRGGTTDGGPGKK